MLRHRQKNQEPAIRNLPKFRNLGDFLTHLNSAGHLAEILAPVSLRHEMTAVHKQILEASGPALRFQSPVGEHGPAKMPVVTNLFGTRDRVAAGLGLTLKQIPELGEFLAALREPAPVDNMRDALSRWPILSAAMATRPKLVKRAPVQKQIWLGKDVNLADIPVQTHWPGEPAPLITWPLVLTRPHGSTSEESGKYNMGVYRMQVLDKTHCIMRWLAHRGGAAHYRSWQAKGEKMPIAVAIGADPATMLSAALPLPETLSELRFAGVLRGERTALVPAKTIPMMVPADAEIILEGWVDPTRFAPEGPYGDHTGYYNSVENFPVMEITAITTREAPNYISTYTGRPPDEPSVIGEVFNDLALPLIRRQIPEVTDLWLPPAACSYRMAIVAIKKGYSGQARRVMMALWGMLPQFSYTKTIVVVDQDIDPHNWDDVIWAMATRMDPARDVMVMDNTPMDYLDFASPKAGLAGKLGIDATNKLGSETNREWGKVMSMSREAEDFASALCRDIGLGGKATP